jgi:hypothetical protein
MLSYSPYDNVTGTIPTGLPAPTPSLLVTAGLNDPRVSYWEPAKWVAKIRARVALDQGLLRTEMGAGHGGPSGRYDAWKEEALVFAFLLDALGCCRVVARVRPTPRGCRVSTRAVGDEAHGERRLKAQGQRHRRAVDRGPERAGAPAITVTGPVAEMAWD